VSVTAKVNPVAVLAFPAVGDQSTVTLARSPPLPEVIPDFVINPIMQAELAGFTLKVGRATALFDSLMMKLDAPERDVRARVGGLGQPCTVTVIDVSNKVRGVPPAAA
jgi:hypothetical protein